MVLEGVVVGRVDGRGKVVGREWWDGGGRWEGIGWERGLRRWWGGELCVGVFSLKAIKLQVSFYIKLQLSFAMKTLLLLPRDET